MSSAFIAIIVLWLHGNGTEQKAISAPSLEACRANIGALIEYERKHALKPVINATGVCIEFVAP